MMVSWKGNFSDIKQYIRGKPNRDLGSYSTSGLLCDFEVYQGQGHVGPKENNKLGIAENVILNLCKTIPSHVDGIYTCFGTPLTLCLTNAWFSYKRYCKQLNIPTKDDIIFRQFQGKVSASLVWMSVIMKR